MSQALLIVNPSSGNESGKDYANRVEEILVEQYETVIVKFTEKAGDATAFAKDAAVNHFDAVFVMGGDGTVNEGISGLAEQEYRPDFGFIPLGTVNDLGRALGISLDPEEAIEQLQQLKKQKLDVGKVNDHYFIDVVAIGTIPQAVQSVKPEQKTKLGPFAYFMEGAKAMSDNKVYPFELTVDGEAIDVRSMMILVAMSNSVGGFESLLPHAATDDGLLHLLVLKGEGVVDKLALLPKIFAGNTIEDKNVIYRAFKEATIKVADNETLLSNVDGDEGDPLPLHIEVLPQHLTVFVPE